jgi:hypothetical protein
MASQKATASVITLTFGDVAENAHTMQKIGSMAERGITVDELIDIYVALQADGSTKEVELHELTYLGKDGEKSDGEGREEAVVLVVRGFFDPGRLLDEQLPLNPDKQCLMRGEVKNRQARWNLCFSDTAQEAKVEEGLGTIIPFSQLPCLAAVRENLGELSEKLKNLKCEGNYYYDTSKCYIGWHGDAERRVVAGLRLGPYIDGQPTKDSFPLHFRWYQNSEKISDVYTIELRHGDMYIMSEKAVGTDWHTRKTPTLRHSAGYKIPEKKDK